MKTKTYSLRSKLISISLFMCTVIFAHTPTDWGVIKNANETNAIAVSHEGNLSGGSKDFTHTVPGLKASGANVPVTGVVVTPSSLTLLPGASSNLTATISPSDATNKVVKWLSGNPGVVLVTKDGMVMAMSEGRAEITATTEDGGYTASCMVTVTSQIPVTGVALSSSSLSLSPGETSTLTATVSPSNATNQNVAWNSNNASVATVDGTGMVTAVSEGTASITVSTVDGNFTASCNVTVSNPQEYCSSSAISTIYCHINQVNIGSYQNVSSNNNGYAIFENISVNLLAGISYNINLHPGFGVIPNYPVYWRIFLDLNRNGSFDDQGELIYDCGTATVNPIQTTITMPSSLNYGKTRMRVSMQRTNPAGPCETFIYGEVEDYVVNLGSSIIYDGIEYKTVNITTPSTKSTEALVTSVAENKGQDIENMKIYPNPAGNSLFVEIAGQDNIISAKVFDIAASNVIYTWDNPEGALDISYLNSGMYILVVKTDKGEWQKKFVKQ